MIENIIGKNTDYLRLEGNLANKGLLIVFSHTNYPQGKFAMTHILKDMDTNILYVNCKNNDWYQTGIPEIANNIEEALEVFQKIIKHIKPVTITTVGMSMGGYAAILYGLLLKVESILAFTAEIVLGEEYSRSYSMNKCKFYDEKYKNLTELIANNDKTQLNLIYGIYDPIDLSVLSYGIEKIFNNSNTKISVLSGNHTVTIQLDIRDMLERLIQGKDISKSKMYSRKKIRLPITKEFLDITKRTMILSFTKESKEICAVIEKHKDKLIYPNICIAYAQSNIDEKNYNKAKRVLFKAQRMDSKWHNTYHLLGILYFNESKYNKAIKYFKKSSAINKQQYTSKYRLALCYIAKKQYKNAIKNLESITRENNKYSDAYYKLAEIYLNQRKYLEADANIKVAIKLVANKKQYIDLEKEIYLKKKGE